MFSILKQTVSALMGDVLPHMEQIAELTATGCNQHPCAAGLDVLKLVILTLHIDSLTADSRPAWTPQMW